VTPAEKTLREVADAFHRIAGSLNADRLLSRDGYKMPTIVFDKLVEAKLTPEAMMRVAVDGYELCIRTLAEMGASDVTIHECGERSFGEDPR